MYMFMKSKQNNGSIITLLILKYWKICFANCRRYLIGITKNDIKIHRSIPCSPRIHLDGGETESSPQTLQPPFDSAASTEHYEEWILHRWSQQVKRDMKLLMYDHYSPSIDRSKPFVDIQGIFETSPHIFLSYHWSPPWSHFPESFTVVNRENDTIFFTCRSLCFPTKILYPWNLCHSSKG